MKVFYTPMHCLKLSSFGQFWNSHVSIYLYQICFKFCYPVLPAIPTHLHAEFSSFFVCIRKLNIFKKIEIIKNLVFDQ